ncbi:carbonic anhydrase [Polynucleobacter brandtiae]|uniref:carbonic anhydrase n=1 Tax=Polynucleobacter brandtiae TaxID=1938816 RepID=A0A2M8VJ50_9BURK|nr:carbonic anhydrase [Polynucleobacter brandtiae]PJI76959.1 carbonic anhydrase [Polynucleobacter brandtiae]
MMDIFNSDQQLSQVSPQDALERLIAGNARFLAEQSSTPTLKQHLLNKQAKGQQPYATILGCSDSRVPPELIFDAWLGELFVVRNAGNVLGPSILGTLQYAARHLNTQLFVVMGHEGCGAIKAAINYQFNAERQPEEIESLLDEITPALRGLESDQDPETLATQAVEANVRMTVKRLAETPEGQRQIANGAKLIGSVYDIESGIVRFLD